MNKKTKTLILCLPIIVAIIVAIIVLCVVFAPAREPSLTVSAKPIILEVGESKNIEYTCSKEDADISFEIKNESVAKIANGKLKAVAVGSTTLTITATLDNDTAFTNINVTIIENPDLPVVDLPEEITLYLIDKNVSAANNDGFCSSLTFNAYTDYNFSSTTSNIITRSGNTLIAKKVGETTLSFASKNSNKITLVKAKVLSVPPKLENLPESLTLMYGESINLSFNVSPVYYTGEAKVELTSSDALIIDGTLITAAKGGKCNISVKLNGEVVANIPVTIELPLTIEIVAMEGCSVSGNNLTVTAIEATFEIVIKDEKGEVVNSISPKLVTDLNVIKVLNFYKITGANDGTIDIYVEGYSSPIATIFVYVS